MGTLPRRTPKRLSEKLREIRLKLGLSQNEMVSRMRLSEELTREEVSSFELGRRQPNLMVLWAYANAANVYVDALILDTVDLPEELPSPIKSEGVPRTTVARQATHRRTDRSRRGQSD
jgi:transcriptional regulator with XRE-family HTH domain